MLLLHNDYNNLFLQQLHHLLMMVYDLDHEENYNLDEQHLYFILKKIISFLLVYLMELHTSHIS